MSTRLLPPAFRIPRSAFCIPRSAFRIPRSAFCLLLSAFCILLSASCLLLSACSPTPAPLSTATATPPNLTPETVALDTATPVTPTSTPAPQNTRPQYTLDVQFNYTNKSALVNETIVYTNNSTDTLTSLVLAVEPTCTKSFFLNNLAVNQLPITNYQFEPENIQAYIRHRLEIPLAQSLPPNGQVTVQISFGLILSTVANFINENDLCSQIFGFTAQQVNLVDWYPFIVPYVVGKGWILHDPHYYGEHLAYEAADFDVSVTFSDGSLPVIASSGEEISSEAAITRRFTLEAGRAFVLSFSDAYQVASTTVGDVTIYSYYFPFYEIPAKAVLAATAQSFEIYTQRFGAYPHKTLSVVQGDFDDGMEYSALYYHSKGMYNIYDGTLTNHLTAVAVHETAHQWWFEQVANDQGLEPWLDESLATYSEIIYYEKVEPDALDTWWWTYRFTPFELTRPIDITIYDWYGGERPYWNMTYLNGAHFLKDLRSRIGDEAFFAFLQDYLAQMRGKIATTDDFFRILRLRTSADLSDLVAQYFQNPH